MMKHIRILLSGLLLIIGSNLLMAQTGYDPSNPPEPSARYKITVSASPNYGYTSGSGWYNTGSQAWISSSSYSPDYVFKYWTKNGSKYTEERSFYYTVETENENFVAVYAYEPQSPSEPDGIMYYRLYLKSNISGSCSFNRTSGEKIRSGSSVYLRAYANSGYKFKGWYLGDVKQSDSRDFYYDMPEKDVTLTAHFEYDPDNPDDPQSAEGQPITTKIKAKNYTREYGEANPVFGYSANMDITGTPTITCEATKTSPVGTYPIVVSRGSVEGEDVVLVNGTLTITKAPLVIQGGNYSKKQGEENPAFVLTYNGFKNDETEAVLKTPPTVTCTAEKLSPMGEYDVEVSGGEADNYEITCTNGKLTVTEPEPIVLTANNLTRVYGEANPELTYAVNGIVISGTPELSCEATPTSPVGTYDILISKGTVSNNAVTYVKGTLTITKAPLTISAGNYSKKQGQTNPEFTLSYSGFKNEETSAVLKTQPSVSCEATTSSAVGNYDVIVSGATSDNYEITHVNGRLTVSEADAINLTANNLTRVYGEANPELTYSVSGAELSGTPVLSCEATATSPVGTYDIIISKGTVTNYNDTYVKGTLTITKAPLTISAGNYSKKQGEANPEFTLSYTGFKNNETSAVLKTQPSVSCEATTSSAVGSYDVTVSGATSDNYDITHVNGKLTVSEADAITITANNLTRVYGEANPELTYSVSGGELIGTPVLSCEATATSPVGTYDIIISKGTVSNYNDTYVKGTLTITKAPLTISAGNYSKKQGDANPEFTFSYTGFKNDETSAVLKTQPSVSCEATTSSAVGSYDVIVSGATSDNYEITHVNGKLTVSEVETIIITANNLTRVYGEANPKLTYSASGGELIGTPVLSCEATATSPVGTYDILVSKGTVSNNTVTYLKGTLTITKAPLTISAGNYSKKQGEANPEFTLSYTGFKNNETSAVLKTQPSVSCEATSSSAVGSYDVIVSGATADNYEITHVNGKLTVSEADAITITANNLTRVYGEANPKLTYSVSGGELSGTPVLSCEATAASPVGTYDIIVSKGTVSNNAVTYVKGTLTITKAPLTISAGHYTKKQGEANPQFTLTYNGFKNNDTEASFTTQPTVSCSATKDSPVGDYDVIVSGAVSGNYNISYVNGSLTIEAAPTPEPTPDPTPEPTPEPSPEPQVTTFDEDVDASATKEVPITFLITTADGSNTPTVAISDDKDVSGNVSIPEAVTHNGVEYKVTEIGAGAFQNNTGLTDVSIPASVTSIGSNAFAGCTNLKSITVYNTTPINLSAISARALTRTESGSVFEGVNKETCILYVPEGSVDAYKAAPIWKDFKNILVIGSATGIKGITLAEGETFDVFNLYGLKVKSQATSLDGLPRGIYVVKGKKVMK